MLSLGTCKYFARQCFVSSRMFLCSLTHIDRYTFMKSHKIQKNCIHIYSKLPTSVVSNSYFFMDHKRYYAKRKKGSRQNIEPEEESDDEEEDYESIEPDEIEDDVNVVKKNVPSLRVDSIIKAGLGTSKKKIEKIFYSSRIRLNGEKVLKKAAPVNIGDELDVVKGHSPENDRLLLVDRICLKSVGKPTGIGMYPIRMQVFKELPIENYPDPWVKSDPKEAD